MEKLRNLRRWLFASCCLLLFVSGAAADSGGSTAGVLDDVEQFFKEGKAYINNRYRYEYVDQDGIDDEAKASTLRTRLGFKTGSLYGLSAKLEVEDVTVIGNDTYNSTTNGNTDRPVVADPEGTEINEAYASLDVIPDTIVRGGREALKLDNLRFVGDVGWRQNNQTYDGANIINKSIPDLNLFYGFVGNVNRIFGEDSNNGDWDTSLNLFNARYSGIKPLTITTYAYLLDIDDAPALSTTTFGVRGNGKHPLNDDISILYDAEYAYQRDYEDNPNDYSVNYWRVSTGVSLDAFTISGGLESLGSDDGEFAFSTPFATLHKWNGWADKFLTTPEGGLDDAFGGIKYSIKDVCPHVQAITAQAVYHYFSSEEESTKYGDEWDFDVTTKFARFFLFGVKYANYNSANFATDTEKLIFTLQASFSQ